MLKKISSLFILVTFFIIFITLFFYLGTYFSFTPDTHDYTNKVAGLENTISFTLKGDKIFYDNQEIALSLFEQKILQAKQQNNDVIFKYDSSVTVGFSEMLKSKLKAIQVRYSGLE